MSTISPYIFFDGNCAAAMRFYASVLGGKLEIVTHGELPAAARPPPGNEHLVMHAKLSKADFELMASDNLSSNPYQAMNGFFLSLVYADVSEAKRIFDVLSAGGEVTMAFGKTFWVEAFGMLRDKFGTPWMINGGLQSPANS